MTTTNDTITLVNPWSGALVERKISEMSESAAYCWPEEVCSQLSGHYDTDAEWIRAAVEILGPEVAGQIIIGA